MPATLRPYRGAADLSEMQRIVTDSWLRAGPLVSCTVADLEWWQVNDPDQPLEDNAAIWELDGRSVGWEWLDPPFAGDWHLAPGVPAAPFLDPLLDRIEAAARAAPTNSAGDDGNPPMTRVWALETDAPAVEVFERRGYAPDGLAISHWVRVLPNAGGEPLAGSALPPGYRHASVHWPDDVDRRVEAHRAAFAPSRMTRERYSLMRRQPNYAPDRDRLVVAADGVVAAFATAWWDPVARVGELEPVGTHPDHRRRGLARAACLRALQILDELGARHVVINTGRSNLAAEALYEGLGCALVATRRRYARPLDP